MNNPLRNLRASYNPNNSPIPPIPFHQPGLGYGAAPSDAQFATGLQSSNIGASSLVKMLYANVISPERRELAKQELAAKIFVPEGSPAEVVNFYSIARSHPRFRNESKEFRKSAADALLAEVRALAVLQPTGMWVAKSYLSGQIEALPGGGVVMSGGADVFSLSPEEIAARLQAGQERLAAHQAEQANMLAFRQMITSGIPDPSAPYHSPQKQDHQYRRAQAEQALAASLEAGQDPVISLVNKGNNKADIDQVVNGKTGGFSFDPHREPLPMDPDDVFLTEEELATIPDNVSPQQSSAEEILLDEVRIGLIRQQQKQQAEAVTREQNKKYLMIAGIAAAAFFLLRK
jgi:hypothetical protein